MKLASTAFLVLAATASVSAGSLREAPLDKLKDLAGFKATDSAATEEAATAKAAGGPVDWPPQGVGVAPQTPGQFVPFGKAVPRQSGVTYYTATGLQECMVCKHLVENAYQVGPQFYELAHNAYPEMKDMMHAQQKTLQACPEFANDWCYQDLGGSQQLRAPCPAHLKCHYCLGLNPLHCLDH